MTRSTTKAAATSAIEQAVVTATSPSRKKTNGGSKIAEGFSQIASHPSKQKICCWLQYATNNPSWDGQTPNPHQHYLLTHRFRR